MEMNFRLPYYMKDPTQGAKARPGDDHHFKGSKSVKDLFDFNSNFENQHDFLKTRER